MDTSRALLPPAEASADTVDRPGLHGPKERRGCGPHAAIRPHGAAAHGHDEGVNSGAWTAVGTIALAVVTVAAVVINIIITVQDRRRAAASLTAERELADARLREERDHAEQVRRRERQADNARVLIQRIAALQPYLPTVPGTFTRHTFPQAKYQPVTHHHGDEACREAISSLQHGAFAEAPLLGQGEAAQIAAGRYRHLVQLILTVANDNGPDEERQTGTLRSYARWVRISLRALAENGSVPLIYGGSPEYPQLGLPEHMPVWQPNPAPTGWNEEIDAETSE